MFYRSANLIITSSVMACLAIIAVGVRFWVRGARRIRVGADDFLIVFGLVRLFIFLLDLKRDFELNIARF